MKHRCMVEGCERKANHALPDIDNDRKPFFICTEHLYYLQDKKMKIYNVRIEDNPVHLKKKKLRHVIIHVGDSK